MRRSQITGMARGYWSKSVRIYCSVLFLALFAFVEGRENQDSALALERVAKGSKRVDGFKALVDVFDTLITSPASAASGSSACALSSAL